MTVLWEEYGEPLENPPGADVPLYFGRGNVSLDYDGDVMCVANTLESHSALLYPGAVYVYDRVDDVVTFRERLQSPIPAAYQQFGGYGMSLDFAGTGLLIADVTSPTRAGTYFHNDGAGFVFKCYIDMDAYTSALEDAVGGIGTHSVLSGDGNWAFIMVPTSTYSAGHIHVWQKAVDNLSFAHVATITAATMLVGGFFGGTCIQTNEDGTRLIVTIYDGASHYFAVLKSEDHAAWTLGDLVNVGARVASFDYPAQNVSNNMMVSEDFKTVAVNTVNSLTGTPVSTLRFFYDESADNTDYVLKKEFTDADPQRYQFFSLNGQGTDIMFARPLDMLAQPEDEKGSIGWMTPDDEAFNWALYQTIEGDITPAQVGTGLGMLVYVSRDGLRAITADISGLADPITGRVRTYKNAGPPPPPECDVTDYSELLTSQHRNKAKLFAALEAVVCPVVKTRLELLALPGKFDLDTAVGDQLDKIGEWIGLTRYLNVPVPGEWFSFDIVGLGFDEGEWAPAGGVTTEQVVVPDEPYRLVLKAKVVNNHWDGSIPGAYEIFDIMYEGTGLVVSIKDHGDLTMTMKLAGSPDPLSTQLFEGGLIKVKPAGVRIREYIST